MSRPKNNASRLCRLALSFSPQKGTKNHCFAAQVWGPDGRSLAVVESTEDPADATAHARLFAGAPGLLAALVKFRAAQRRMKERWADAPTVAEQADLWAAVHACGEVADAAVAFATGND